MLSFFLFLFFPHQREGQPGVSNYQGVGGAARTADLLRLIHQDVGFMRPHDLHALAHRRLLAIDLGARFIGLAARTCVLRGAFPCGLIQGKPKRTRDIQLSGGATVSEELQWTLQRVDERALLMGHTKKLSPPSGRTSRHSTQADALATALAEHQADAAVVGMPYHADGSRSRECAIVERHVAALQAAWPTPVPVLFWDESFSTRRVVGARTPPKGSKRDRASHALAACLILEEVLEMLRPLEEAAQANVRSPRT